MDSSLVDILCYLQSTQNADFFARIIGAFRVEKTTLVPAMAVLLRKRHYALLYNEDWLKQATYNDVIAVIHHEAHHVVLEHIQRQILMGNLYGNGVNKRLFDMATPIAIDLVCNYETAKYNKAIMTVPGLVYPGREPFADIPENKTYEQTLQLIMDRLKQDAQAFKRLLDFLKESGFDVMEGFGGEGEGKDGQPGGQGKGKGKGKGKDGKGKGEGDSKDKGKGKNLGQKLLHNHKLWQQELEKMSIEERMTLADELKRELQQVIRKAVEDHQKSRGTVPSYIQEMIDKVLTAPVVPFAKILRGMVINTQRYKLKRSITRPSRRHAGVPEFSMFPGHTKDRAFTVVFGIDTSGSMGREELTQGLSELQALQRVDPDIKITILEADAAVAHEYTIGPSDELNFEMHGRGGTDFNPTLRRAQELKPDIMFYYTDGCAPPPAVESRVMCPFVWLITPGGQTPDHNWGRIVEIGKYGKLGEY